MSSQNKFDAQISRIKKLEDRATEYRDKAKVIQTEADELKYQLLKEMDDAGTDIARNSTHTATIVETEVAQIEDFDEAWRWIRRMNKPYLLMRRINNAPYRDEVKARKGKPVPGVKTYVKRTLSVKKTRTP